MKELDNLKEKCSHNFDSIQKQYDNMVFSLEEAGLDFVREIPKFQNIKTGLYNERNKVLGAPRLRSNSSIEAVVPDKFKKFLLAEYSDDDKKILLFCNQRVASIVKYKHILSDDTFTSCPTEFHLLYTIHGVDETTSAVVPLIFCLLPDKTQQTYEILFYMINSRFKQWLPETITVDFELAPIKAVRKVFPNIDVKGCYYHLNRCLFRKAKSLKLTTRVKKGM